MVWKAVYDDSRALLDEGLEHYTGGREARVVSLREGPQARGATVEEDVVRRDRDRDAGPFWAGGCVVGVNWMKSCHQGKRVQGRLPLNRHALPSQEWMLQKSSRFSNKGSHR